METDECAEGLSFPSLPLVPDDQPEWEYRMRRNMQCFGRLPSFCNFMVYTAILLKAYHEVKMLKCTRQNLLLWKIIIHAAVEILIHSLTVHSPRLRIQEIVPNVFLGPYSSASRNQLDTLLKNNISHIVCIRHPLEVNRIKPNFPQHFKYLVLDVQDVSEEHIIKYFPMVREFIEECLHLKGKVLVHGNGGISRSASLVIAYLMETYGLTYNKAFYYVQQKRYCINPNEGFVRQLIEYEPIYLARYQIKESNQEGNHLKRQLEMDGDQDLFSSDTSLKRDNCGDFT